MVSLDILCVPLKVENGNGFTGHIVCSSALACQRLIVEHFVTPVDREVQKAALRALPLINDSPQMWRRHRPTSRSNAKHTWCRYCNSYFSPPSDNRACIIEGQVSIFVAIIKAPGLSCLRWWSPRPAALNRLCIIFSCKLMEAKVV